MKRILLMLAIATPLTASADEYHTVEWFRDHPDSRKQTIYWCHNNAGLAPHTPNCPNAEQGALLAEERQAAAKNGSLSITAGPPVAQAMILNACRVALQQHSQPVPSFAANCRDLHAPGY